MCSGDLAKQITIHVPDSLFEKALALKSDYRYGKVTDGKRWAYLGSIYPNFSKFSSSNSSNYHPESYYDVTGDGKMEVFGGGYGAFLLVTSLDGRVLRKEGIYNSSPLGTLNERFDYMQMGMYDKEGLPLLTANYPYKGYPTKVYSYAKNQFVFKSEKGFPYITLADINGNGLKEIIPSATTYDGYYFGLSTKDGTIDIVRMTADGSFVSDKLYVTSDTTAIHSSILDEYTPNSGQIGVSISSGSNGSGISETSQAKQMVAANGVATYSMDAPTGYCTARDLNGDGLIDLQDGNTEGTCLYHQQG